MKFKSIILTTLTSFLLVSCASGPSNYQLYSETQKAIAQANAVADTARYNALLEIAKNGDSAAKVAAVLSIQMGGGGGAQRSPQQVAPPESFGDTALKWTSVLLPSFAQLYTVQRNTAVAMRQSDNQAAIAISTNNTFRDMNAAGHTANTNIANSGFTANTTGFNALSASNAASLNTLQSTGIAGFNALRDMSKDSNTALTTLGTAGITGVSNTARDGITGITNTAQNANTAITTLGAQSSQSLTAITTANQANLGAAISKLTGTTTTTTTSNTSNTTNTTSYLSCPPGQSLVTGLCK